MGNYYSWPALVSLSLVAGLLSWTVYDLDSSKGELRRVRGELMSTADQLLRKSEAYEALSRQHAGLAEALKVEREKNKSFEGQIGEIASTVGALEKLRKTDPQLLQKYSKVYFLNEHYAPPRLTTINPDYTVNKERPFEIHADVWPHLRRLLEEAEEDGVDLRVASSFRSFGTQSSLKSAYVTTYGAGTANRFSADQGYSEHQLGTTVDFSTSKLGGDFSKFETTPAYAWLTKEAHKYGFVLSYPKNNAYYQHEPWHWRFVGIDLARKLQEEGKHFYDLDQRELDSYLVKIFD